MDSWKDKLISVVRNADMGDPDPLGIVAGQIEAMEAELAYLKAPKPLPKVTPPVIPAPSILLPTASKPDPK